MVFLLVLSFGTGFGFSQSLLGPAPGLPEEFNTLPEVWHYLEDYYVNKHSIDPQELSEGAIEGLLEALDDPYTYYLDAETYQLAISDLQGSFEGIGAVITVEDDELTVVSPIAGSPADGAGIRAGDKILEVDGEPTSAMSLQEAVLRVRGPKGTTVTLLILHQGETTPTEMEIRRAEITIDSVCLDLLPDNIAHIRITHLSERTHAEFSSALDDARGDGAEGIILDLRNNPGGYLHVAVDIASEFLDGGIVLYEADDEGNIVKEWPASPGGLALDLPVALLVNGGSASGSEVLAGALRDRGRAPLIGTRTYGKGSVCLVQELSDGSAVYVTTTRWLTPDGRLIEGQGLAPDFEITDEETQLQFAIEHVKAQL
jgi:carboxyl-terminal processing protease